MAHEKVIDNLEWWLEFSHIDYRSSKGGLELIPLLSSLAFMLLHRSFLNGDFSFSNSDFLIPQIDYILELWFLILVQWFPNLIHRLLTLDRWYWLLKLDRWFKTHTTFVMFGLPYNLLNWIASSQHSKHSEIKACHSETAIWPKTCKVSEWILARRNVKQKQIQPNEWRQAGKHVNCPIVSLLLVWPYPNQMSKL